MAEMRSSRLAPVVALVLALVPAWCLAATGSRLSHRVWVLSELPSLGELQGLRSAGVSALAVQVDQLELRGTSSNLTLTRVGDLGSLSGWSVAAQSLGRLVTKALCWSQDWPAFSTCT